MRRSFKIFRPHQLRDMRIGEWGYIEILNVYFNENVFAIPWDARIYREQSDTRFYIKRIGKTLKDGDFFVDLSSVNDTAWEPIFMVSMMDVYEHPEAFLIVKDIDIYIFQEKIEEGAYDDINQYPEDEREAIESLKRNVDWKKVFPPDIASLKEQLDNAVEEQNFMEAARLKRVIDDMMERQKNNKQGD